MKTFSALLAICAGNSPVPGEFPTQRPVTRSFDVYFDLRPNKSLSKQSWGWWFEMLLRPLWRHRNDTIKLCKANRTFEILWRWANSNKWLKWIINTTRHVKINTSFTIWFCWREGCNIYVFMLVKIARRLFVLAWQTVPVPVNKLVSV